MGRHTKLTPELQEKIVRYIEAGNYARTACLACGICEETYYDWLRKAEDTKTKSKYSDFSESIANARAKAEIRNATLVNKAAETDAKHAEWWLERTNWKKWGRKDHLTQDVNVKNTPPAKIVFEVVDGNSKDKGNKRIPEDISE